MNLQVLLNDLLSIFSQITVISMLLADWIASKESKSYYNIYLSYVELHLEYAILSFNVEQLSLLFSFPILQLFHILYLVTKILYHSWVILKYFWIAILPFTC